MSKLATLFAACVLWAGCGDAACLDGGTTCRIVSPCQSLSYSCAAGSLNVLTIDPTHPAPGGEAALGRRGDILLSNDQVVAVIAGLGDQNYVELSGGSLLDLQPVGSNADALNQVITAVGVLPRDSAFYTSLQILDERPTRVAVQLYGTLYTQPDTVVTTLFELRPCEPGIRVRSTVYNGTGSPQGWTLSDGWYWSGREPIPFTPGLRAGFNHPPLDLSNVQASFQTTPFLAASSHAGAPIAYSEVGCVEQGLNGFQNEFLSTMGLPSQVVDDRGTLSLERFIMTAPHADVAAAADLALEARRQIFAEPWVTLSGMVKMPPAATPYADQYSVLIAEGTASSTQAQRTPWTQVVPNADGTWSARVPSGKSYIVELDAYGRDVAEQVIGKVAGDLSTTTMTAPGTARVNVTVHDATPTPLDAEIYVVPADQATASATTASFHGQLGTCTPWLGNTPGGAPACNRFLVWHGNAAPVAVDMPLGNYWLYAYHGPFYSLQREMVQLTAASQTVNVDFTLTSLPLRIQGTISADFHVHGAGSFDSSIPDLDRVLSFAAADLDVGIATDHDIVTDYADIAQQLDLDAVRSWVDGVETTGHMPFLAVPGSDIPVVIGHYNFWPLAYLPNEPRNGGPFDELLEPGALFDRFEPLFTNVPVRELNHPWAEPVAGRDLGFPRAIMLSTLQDLPASDDGTNEGIFVRTPAGGRANDDHDAQEVMNGSQNDVILQYRAFWWFMLNEGLPKSGTANSDSHSLSDENIGSPRNIVFTDTVSGPTFDIARLDNAVLAGRLFGTNGPMIEASIVDTVNGMDVELPYGMAVLTPSSSARLRIAISAAPWVPVDEVRIIVNGTQVQKLTGLPPLGDAFGTTGLMRFTSEVPLSALLAGVGANVDAWIVVEAGTALPIAADFGGGAHGEKDGIPDTGDNNGDGVVDKRDIEAGSSYGPLNIPASPDTTSPLYHFHQVIDGYPFAFTNPFLIDRNGNGRFDKIGVAP